MNIFDDMPDIPPCPKCGHNGEGLEYAFPHSETLRPFSVVQVACLKCGFHAALKPSYDEAVKAFVAGEDEVE